MWLDIKKLKQWFVIEKLACLMNITFHNIIHTNISASYTCIDTKVKSIRK